MKYITPLFTVVAAPVWAHDVVVPHSHDANFHATLGGLAVLAVAMIGVFVRERAKK